MKVEKRWVCNRQLKKTWMAAWLTASVWGAQRAIDVIDVLVDMFRYVNACVFLSCVFQQATAFSTYGKIQFSCFSVGVPPQHLHHRYMHDARRICS